MLKLWGRKNSSNVKKIMWVCAELGIAYERIEAGQQHGVNNTDDYRQRLNPNALIPVIEDEGFVLWESNAILRYLCAKHGEPPFWPNQLQTRASADRWMEWQSTTLGPQLGPVFQHITRLAPEQRDLQMINTNVPRVANLWKILDAHLAQSKWLAGDDFTAGDIPLAILAYTWNQLALDRVGLEHYRETLPHCSRWYAQLQANPNYREIVMIGLS